MDELGPFSILVDLSTYVAAVVIYVVTHLVKVGLDISQGGTEKRKLNPWLTQVVLPAVPLVLGFVYGAFVPFRPDAIHEYVTTHNASMVWVGGAFGVVVGQFSDYIYTRIRKGVRGFSEHAERKRASMPPPEEGNGAAPTEN